MVFFSVLCECQRDLSLHLGRPFRDVINSIVEDKMTLYMETDTPLYLKGDNTHYLIAPRIATK